ncbi:response regulator [Helicobacter saguini]|uniref:Chemotaxis signal transduction protein CheV n=1 Tax=Helicobacter saguini TaxID=1548018 RepID=A0A347VT23_9HELI|nr:chemotaxis protein [Helicobacter saguini]MWV62267.1 response regulator [Helicobacter saguini]MWV67060.1 response regulator [Helicobacter saguini]MWV69410.1 response regulator [Helicobacter saguini]MWV71036.1 response regulator [Helicobacter saguini]TLD95058.1 chemotaxis signal transduction protein CheV [Helicobacter saguini]
MINEVDKTTSLHLNNEAQFLCFTLEDSQHEKDVQLYAMNVFKIREIIYYDGDLTETAGNNDGVVIGFLTVRGESIPLVDMRRWLYYNPAQPKRDLHQYSVQGNKTLVILCNFSQFTVGLKILGVKRIIQRSWDEVIVGSEYGFDGSNKITATTKFDDGSVVQIMDVERMLVDAFPHLEDGSDLELDALKPINSDKVILIAEDSKPAQKSLQIIMHKLGLRSFTFPNGKALLDYLYSPGVIPTVGAVITDLEMPLISGFEVLKHIRDNENTKNLPVIVNSSMSNDSNIEKAQTLKANAFITKSKPAEIEDALREALEA